MKKLHYLFVLILCAFTTCCITACGGNEDDMPDEDISTSKGISATFSKTELTFDSESSSELITIMITGTNNTFWRIESDAYWCAVKPSSSLGAGSYPVTVKCDENPYDEDRTATLTLYVSNTNQEKTIECKVTQKQKETLTLTSHNIIISKFGGTFEIEVVASAQYSYVIEDNAQGWIHESDLSRTRSITTSYLSFDVEENTSFSREGNITIKGNGKSEKITISQGAGQCELSVYVDSPGSLQNMISKGRLSSIDSIAISGRLNRSDIDVIHKMTKLVYLDLENADIEGNELQEYECGLYINSMGQLWGDSWCLPYESLKNLILPKTLKKWTYVCDANYTSPLVENLSIPSGMETIVLTTLFSNQKWCGISNIYIKDLSEFVTKNYDGLFFEDSKLFCNKKIVRSVFVPSGTKSIGCALNGYTYLMRVDIPASVETIANYAFKGSSITEMTINSFEHWAKVFNYYNTPFTEKKSGKLIHNGKYVDIVEIPASIRELNGAYAFVEGIKEVHCKSTTPARISLYDFNLIDKHNVTLYVPTGTKQIYELSDWGSIFEIIKEE